MNGSGRRGFTIIEMAVVLAIVGILAALAIGGLMYGTGRARVNNAGFQLGSFFSIAANRARSTGDYQYVVVWQTNAPLSDGETFGVYLIDSQGQLTNWLNAKAGDPTTMGKLADSLKLSRSGGFGFTKVDKLKFSALKAPFSSIALTESGAAPSLMTACTFCIATSDGAIGAIEFSPEGLVRNATGANTAGGALSLSPTAKDQSTNTRVIAISAPGGVVKIY